MKGKRFADVSELKKKTLEVLNNISTEEFQKCFQQWEKRWYKCIESKGQYFEGDWSFNGIKPNKPFKKIIAVIFGSPLVYLPFSINCLCCSVFLFCAKCNSQFMGTHLPISMQYVWKFARISCSCRRFCSYHPGNESLVQSSFRPFICMCQQCTWM